MANLNNDNKSKFDPQFTQTVIDAIAPNTSPRTRQVMSSLIRHIHDFARENELTVEEWTAGVQFLNWAGQMSTETRNEGQLLCDVIGLESYVVYPELRNGKGDARLTCHGDCD